ncbi:MAG: ABC transporter permease [Pseudobutyrivibrio sp.]|nr:ABC transporter permease [Pseudobutyrivibrio sp.]
MNIVSRLTLRHLAENKKRTIVTTIGIIASTALMTAIIVGLFSFFRFFGDLAEATTGSWHVTVGKITDQQLEKLRADDRVGEIGFTDDTQAITGFIVDSDAKARYRIGNIRHIDEIASKWYITSDYDGTLPTNSGEVAVEEDFLKDNNLNLSIGDTINFQEGRRYMEEADGSKTGIGGTYRSNEKFEKQSDESCVITAILHGNKATGGFNIVRGLEPNCTAKSRVAVITMKGLNVRTAKTIKETMADNGIKNFVCNVEYLGGHLCLEGWGNNAGPILKIIGTMLGIVVFVSVVLIYNAFAMSTTERIRYLGMLASVGATKKQKRLSVYFEGLILGIVGIPIGIGCGILGSYATLHILGRMMYDADIFEGMEIVNGTIPLRAPLALLVVVVILSAITIAISSIKPARMASSIMPVEALRENNTVKVKAKQLRVNKLVRKIFGYEGELAYKNIKRNGKKSKVIIATITLSIVLFLTVDYFDTIFEKSNIYDVNIGYQVSACAAYSDKDRLKEALEETEGVDRVFHFEMIFYNFEKPSWDDDWVSPNRDILNPDFFQENYKALDGKITKICLMVFEDDMFNDLIKSNNLSTEDFYGDQLNGVVLNNYYHDERMTGLFNDKIIGQKLYYDDPENNPPAVNIVGLVDYDASKQACNLCANQTINVIVPSSMYFDRMSKIVNPDELVYTYAIECKNSQKMVATISDMLENGEYKAYSCFDEAKNIKQMNTISIALKTAVYGFTVLLILIVIANIVNTISTGVILRRKEFAMLRSVGMTEKGFKKLLSLETILYGLKSLGMGLPLSLLITYLINLALSGMAMPFVVNWKLYSIVIVAVFAVVSISMLLSTAKVKNDNIIDALKDDIC